MHSQKKYAYSIMASLRRPQSRVDKLKSYSFVNFGGIFCKSCMWKRHVGITCKQESLLERDVDLKLTIRNMLLTTLVVYNFIYWHETIG